MIFKDKTILFLFEGPCKSSNAVHKSCRVQEQECLQHRLTPMLCTIFVDLFLGQNRLIFEVRIDKHVLKHKQLFIIYTKFNAMFVKLSN